MWPFNGKLKYGHIRQVVAKYRLNLYGMHCDGKLELRAHNTSYCLIEVVTKAGLIDSYNYKYQPIGHCLFIVVSIANRLLVCFFFGCNDTFNNISVISWRSVLLVVETGIPGENYRPVASHWQRVNKNIYGWFMVCNATYNNVSVISWRSVLLVEETGIPSENHHPVVTHCQSLSHNVISSTPRHEWCSNSQL